VVVLLDEVDRLFAHPEYCDEFFGLVRSWHNNRAFNDTWERFNVVLSYSTEARALIKDHSQSPFNVGSILDAKDFTRSEVIELNRRHGDPLAEQQLDRLIILLAGHPYLVRHALYELVRQDVQFEDLIETACHLDGPFGDHLSRYLFWLGDRPHLREAFGTALRTEKCEKDADFHDLRSCGLLKGHTRRAAEPRCGLYRQFFMEHL
jgi:hypothetical protein